MNLLIDLLFNALSELITALISIPATIITQLLGALLGI